MFYYTVSLLRSSAPVLTYSSDKELTIGDIVLAPLKSSLKRAVVIDEVDIPSFDTAPIFSIEYAQYSSNQMSIAKFMSEYYFSSFSEAISLFLPYNYSSLEDNSDVSHWIDKAPKLTKIQSKAYNQIQESSKTLLFGVTGSGKTEIFIKLMCQVLDEGKSSIFLMPEISLTPQMEKRLKQYFGTKVAMWHSKLTKKRKETILNGIASGEISIIAGARSALFVPLSNVGLIVVDEEHDDSYKAMTRPRYHARDVAVLMADRLGAKLLLASATPSLGSYHRYSVVRLQKPYIQTQKRYKFVSGSGFGSSLLSQVAQNFRNDNQSLIFVPTRGNFKYLYCQSCGKTHLCPYCSVGMALHRYHIDILDVITVAIVKRYPRAVASCGYAPLSSDRIGTVEVKEMLEDSVEGITVEQFDKDSISTPKRLKDALTRFETGESRVLLGTQMLSKGHDYANITLSVITGLDYILGLADYRARERAMSLLFQIAGRSGRAKDATIFIQSNMSEQFVPYIGDYEKFLDEEMEFRRDFYPPFVSLARILISHKRATVAEDIMGGVLEKLQSYTEIEIVGSGKAPYRDDS